MANEVGVTRGLLREIHSALLASNRAIVSVKKFEWRLTGEKWLFITLWENGGNTPAKSRTSQVAGGLSKMPLVPDFRVP